jgi:hypothetical protein
MPRVFYIQAIRSGRLNPSVVVDWIMVRSEDLAAVKRQVRMLAQTATDSAWIWPRAEAIRIVDENGLERFRCWCRVALRLPERRPPSVQKAIDVAFRKSA